MAQWSTDCGQRTVPQRRRYTGQQHQSHSMMMHHHPPNSLSFFHEICFLSFFFGSFASLRSNRVVGACLVLHLASPCLQHNVGPPTDVYFLSPRGKKILLHLICPAPSRFCKSRWKRTRPGMLRVPSRTNEGVCFIQTIDLRQATVAVMARHQQPW